MSRNRTFFDPIILPDGRQLVMLRDAAQYITKFPKTEHDAPEYQAAMQALLLVAEHNGPTDFARIGVMRALNRHVERVFNPDREDHYWRRRGWHMSSALKVWRRLVGWSGAGLLTAKKNPRPVSRRGHLMAAMVTMCQ
ncbi:hypothetical protein [Bradyrhizobium sp.]|uniref:hypothetical protein n=1 Tax=Bradyrhizobium sp. TaxID=376 RepID=UPI003C1F14A1